jgi:hypothetical protein
MGAESIQRIVSPPSERKNIPKQSKKIYISLISRDESTKNKRIYFSEAFNDYQFFETLSDITAPVASSQIRGSDAGYNGRCVVNSHFGPDGSRYPIYDESTKNKRIYFSEEFNDYQFFESLSDFTAPAALKPHLLGP